MIWDFANTPTNCFISFLNIYKQKNFYYLSQLIEFYTKRMLNYKKFLISKNERFLNIT